jgi:hypothetical protein
MDTTQRINEPVAAASTGREKQQDGARDPRDAKERLRRVLGAVGDFLSNAGTGRLPRRTIKSGRFGGPKTSVGQAFGQNRCSLFENAGGRRSGNPKPGILRDVQ